MISISVLCCEHSLSICTLGSTVIFGLCAPGLNFVSINSTTSISPETASASFRFRRSISEGLSSSVRNRSENRKVSSTTPALLEKASAFRMFIPQDESVPTTWENKPGQSRVNKTSSK